MYHTSLKLLVPCPSPHWVLSSRRAGTVCVSSRRLASKRCPTSVCWLAEAHPSTFRVPSTCPLRISQNPCNNFAKGGLLLKKQAQRENSVYKVTEPVRGRAGLGTWSGWHRLRATHDSRLCSWGSGHPGIMPCSSCLPWDRPCVRGWLRGSLSFLGGIWHDSRKGRWEVLSDQFLGGLMTVCHLFPWWVCAGRETRVTCPRP